MKVLFLCSELAGYFSNCVQQLKEEAQCEILLVQWPNSNKAPFEHSLTGIELIDKSSLTRVNLMQLVENFNPDIVYVSGWMDSDYKRISRKLKRKGAIVICGLDNIWRGTLRQRLACLLSSLVIKPYYSHMWVAGHRQYHFAKRLGYSYDKILTGLYAADIEKFQKERKIPKEKYIVYVGRFEKVKGVDLLYDVFCGLSEEERNGWKLKLIGNGSLKSMIKSTGHVEVYEFMQPIVLSEFVADAGGFILPSIDEPWGVVVQEFAAAGMPLLLSDTVNSGERFLIHNYNGLKFQSQHEESLKNALICFFRLSEKTRTKMGDRSAKLALRGAPEYWVANFMSLFSAVK